MSRVTRIIRDLTKYLSMRARNLSNDFGGTRVTHTDVACHTNRDTNHTTKHNNEHVGTATTNSAQETRKQEARNKEARHHNKSKRAEQDPKIQSSPPLRNHTRPRYRAAHIHPRHHSLIYPARHNDGTTHPHDTAAHAGPAAHALMRAASPDGQTPALRQPYHAARDGHPLSHARRGGQLAGQEHAALQRHVSRCAIHGGA
mmetsp:Transcript_21815/g.60719  ORF Transcript_21815/g.60719 Transcript_21815/m.60719 type:complete len:201 (+) Transcript_21815:515-1117(+)